MNSSPLPLLFLSVLSLGAWSQSEWGGGQQPVPPCLPFQPENRIAWPASGFGAASAFGRTVVIEWNGDYSPDAVVVADGVAVALFEPAYYDVLEVIPGLSDVSDVATLPVGTEANRDLLLVVDANGLSSVGWNDGAFTTPVVIARGQWLNARTLHVDDLDGDGLDDVVGVTQNGLTVVTRTSQNGVFTAGTSFTPGAEVFDAVTVDWDNDGTRELAIAAADGLHVYTPTGPLVDFVAYASTFGCIARFGASDVVPCGELLAWARGAPGGGAELVVRGAVNETRKELYFADTECSINSFVPRAMLAGKYDADGDDELLLVSDATPHAIVLRNMGAGGHFDPTSPDNFDIVRLTPTASAPYAGTGIPAFADLDLERPDDVLCPVKGTNEVLAFRTLPFFRAIDTTTQEAPTSDNVFIGYSEFTPGDEHGPGPGDDEPGMLRLAFKVLDQYDDFTRVLLKVWTQYEVDGVMADPVLEANPRTHVLATTGGDLSYQWVEVEFAFPSGAVWDPQNHYYVEMRFEKLGSVLKKSPKFFGGLTLPDTAAPPDHQLSDDCFDYLVGLGIPNSAFALKDENGLPSPLDSEQLVGAYVPMHSLPGVTQIVPFESTQGPPARLFTP